MFHQSRRLQAIHLVILSFTLLAPMARAQTSKPASDLSIEELIDRLRYMNEDHYSVRTNIIAAAGPLPQGQRFLQEPGPEPSAVMEEIVKRGPSCIAALCDHLSDARKTHAVIGHPTDYVAKFDWNARDDRHRPSRIKDGGWLEHKENVPGALDHDKYIVTVGDLCFEVLGRIVNRDYRATWYQMSGIIYVNSPVLFPELADAVRKEWSTRTPRELRQSLIQDVELPDRAGRAEGGVQSLSQYFPESVGDAVRARLKLPTYDHWLLGAFVEQTLAPEGDLANQKVKISQFLAANPTYSEILVRRLNGPIDGDHPALVSAVDMSWNWMFIESLPADTSAEVDAAVYKEFCGRNQDAIEKMTQNDYIAVECVKHLAHKKYDAELLAYSRRRVAVMTDKWDKLRMQDLVDLLAPVVKK